MFDLDVSKMLIVGIVALAVIPPKDLPRVMRTVGQTVGRVRRMAAEFQGQFMEAIREVEREADLDSVKKEFQAINDQAKIDTSFDPVGLVRDDVTKAVQDQEPAPAPKPDEAARPENAPGGEIGQSEISLVASAPSELPQKIEAGNTPAESASPPARQSAAE
jgi:sec-independent protein translocase protein TatB